MMEGIIVAGIVVIAAVMSGRSFYRTFRRTLRKSGAGEHDGCGCAGGCQGCACRNSMDLNR